MTYRITGLAPEQFAPLFAASPEDLAAMGAVRVTASAKPGYPCRVTLEDAEPGEELILLHHVSHDVETPYRSAYAIFVREGAGEPADYVDAVPPVFEGRPLAMRGFDEHGMLGTAMLALPGEADAKIREMLANKGIAYIDVHNAAHGCFAARVQRNGE
jgi:hypothetical protein